jgi:hypothetical protein
MTTYHIYSHSKVGGDVPQLPYMPSWYARDQIYVYILHNYTHQNT